MICRLIEGGLISLISLISWISLISYLSCQVFKFKSDFIKKDALYKPLILC